MYYLPVFLQKSLLKEAFEASKGISLRFLLGNNKEQSEINLILFFVDSVQELYKTADKKESGIIPELKQNSNCHLGIILSDSDFVESIETIENFILLAPSTGRRFSNKPNIFQIYLSEWNADALRKNLSDWYIVPEDVLLLSPYSSGSCALSPYNWLSNKINYSNILKNKTKIKGDILNKLKHSTIYVLIGYTKYQWQLLDRLSNEIRDTIKNKQIIATSAFEDWRIPVNRRKSIAEKTMYIYPILSDKSEKVIQSFENKFNYKPSIYHLTAYDTAGIAIEVLLESGPECSAMMSYFTSKQFECLIGKMGFYNGKPHLIGKSPDELFIVKFIDEEGNYKIGAKYAPIIT